MNKQLDTRTALTDVITIIAAYFIMLFIIAFLNMNPIAKKKDIDTIDRFLIKLEWNDKNTSDYDLWLLDAAGDRIGYSNKNGRIAYLDRDDLGKANDTIIIDGKKYELELNTETIFIRQSVPGRYFISVHLFSKNEKTEDSELIITLIDIRSGARILATKTLSGFEHKEEKFALSFTINHKNQVVDIDKETPFKILSNTSAPSNGGY